MSSPIYASSPLPHVRDVRHRSSSFAGPRLDLVLRPSQALGPFKLGHSLWHILNYLRSQQSLFPQINITYDETNPRLSPVAVVIQPNLHLIFHGATQRLVMITLENLDGSTHSAAQIRASSSSSIAAEPSHRPVNLIYNGKLIYSKGSSRSPAVALNRSTLHQILGPTYPGHPEPSSISPDSLVATAYASKDQGASKGPNEFLLTYPGLAFCFALKSKASKDMDVDKLQPVSTIHIFSGTDPNNPQDVIAPISATPSPLDTTTFPTRTHKGTLSPTAAVNDYQELNTERDRAALDTEAIYVRCPLLEADLIPGRGVVLHCAVAAMLSQPSPVSEGSPMSTPLPVASNSYAVELVLGVTTPQDAISDLGTPQKVFYKEDDRMRIHGPRPTRDRTSENSNSTIADHGSANSAADNDDSAFFYNYFDLGIDLLFSKEISRMPSVAEAFGAAAMGQARLEKVICHTNVLGDALFQRYCRCPWRVVPTTSTDQRGAGEGGFSFQDHFDSTLNAGQDDRGMELDRGTCAEFRGAAASGSENKSGRKGGARQQAMGKRRDASGESANSPERGEEVNPASQVILDLSTRLVGRQSMVLEVARDGSMVGVVLF